MTRLSGDMFWLRFPDPGLVLTLRIQVTCVYS